jgi:cobalt-zinc-cadmium efflux system protein
MGKPAAPAYMAREEQRSADMGLEPEQEHNHHQHGHVHGPGHMHAQNERRVGWAALLTGGFMLVEAAGGLLAGSLALLADAGHMLADAASLTLAWLAFRIAHRPADWQRTYGFHRFQVLAAYSNGLTLAFIALAIGYAAIKRLYEPTEVLAAPMLAVAAIGLIVNLAAFRILHGADRENLNIKGAMLHVLGDVLGSVAAIGAALVILWTGWTPIDPLLSALVALLILRSAWFLVRDTGHILLEGAPVHLDVRTLRKEVMAAVPGVEDIHHVHAWSLSQDKPMVTLHARIADLHGGDRIASAIKSVLRARYGVDHATVEIESAACADHHRAC